MKRALMMTSILMTACDDGSTRARIPEREVALAVAGYVQDVDGPVVPEPQLLAADHPLAHRGRAGDAAQPGESLRCLVDVVLGAKAARPLIEEDVEVVDLVGVGTMGNGDRVREGGGGVGQTAEVVDVAHDLAARIAAMAPIAAQSTKNLIRVATSTSVEVGMRYENDMFAYCMMTGDAAEGRRAFAEKRPPVFTGA